LDCQIDLVTIAEGKAAESIIFRLVEPAFVLAMPYFMRQPKNDLGCQASLTRPQNAESAERLSPKHVERPGNAQFYVATHEQRATLLSKGW
jgi:hypothetical protein